MFRFQGSVTNCFVKKVCCREECHFFLTTKSYNELFIALKIKDLKKRKLSELAADSFVPTDKIYEPSSIFTLAIIS